MSDQAPNQHAAAGEPNLHIHTPSDDHPVAANLFTDSELASFKSEDFSAGKAVVVLMLSIFLTGVFIYTIVAYWVTVFSH